MNAPQPFTPPQLSLSGRIMYAAQTLYPGFAPRLLIKKLSFAAKALANRRHLVAFANRLAVLPRHRALAFDPEMMGLIEWPYINNLWEFDKRLDVVATHYELVDTLPNKLQTVNRENPLILCDLHFVSDSARLVMDRPAWFVREGELVLNLFQGELRIASIAFVISKNETGLCLIVGAIQGIHRGIPSDVSLNIYRTVTKDLEGLRPRSLIIDVLRIISASVGAASILAVQDKNRHHRHRFFGEREQLKFSANYDDIWTEHGGIPSATPGFYSLPMTVAVKTADEIPSRKRAMYRRRYEILEHIRESVHRAIRL